MQQLEFQQAALNSRLDNMMITISSSQDKNARAICDMRSTTNGFLTELISVVGQQFEKLQADTKQTQAKEIKVNLHSSSSSAAATGCVPFCSSSMKCHRSVVHFTRTIRSSGSILIPCDSMSNGKSGHVDSAIPAHFTLCSFLQAEVEKALNGTCSTEAGISLLEQLVQRTVAHYAKEPLDLKVGFTALQKYLICIGKALCGHSCCTIVMRGCLW